MADMFSVLAKFEDDSSHATGINRARISAVARVDHKFSKFVSKTANDREAKIDMVRQDILDTVVEACADHGITERADIQSTLDAAMASLRSAKPNGCTCDEDLCECEAGKMDEEAEARANREAATKESWNFDKKKDKDSDDKDSKSDSKDCKSDDKDCDDECDSDGDSKGDKPKKGVNPFAKKDDKESSAKTADGPATGDTYQQETVTLPTSTADGSPTGLGGPVSETNTDRVPEGGLDPIDVGSVKNKSEMQEIRPKDFEEKLTEFDPAHSDVLKQVDADKPIGEEQVGDRTDTFSTPEGQASAVTSSWRIEAGDE